MISRRATLAGMAMMLVSACTSKFKRYTGPEVTRVVVHKSQRRLYLLNGTDVLKAYEIGLGFAPEGHKQFEGDGKTPEGSYFINRRNPRSEFHLSLGISYPNTRDRAFAASRKKSPGGDIFVHGHAAANRHKRGDWTAGCIAVQDDEIEEIYAMVRDGTQIDIHA